MRVWDNRNGFSELTLIQGPVQGQGLEIDSKRGIRFTTILNICIGLIVHVMSIHLTLQSLSHPQPFTSLEMVIASAWAVVILLSVEMLYMFHRLSLITSRHPDPKILVHCLLQTALQRDCTVSLLSDPLISISALLSVCGYQCLGRVLETVLCVTVDCELRDV